MPGGATRRMVAPMTLTTLLAAAGSTLGVLGVLVLCLGLVAVLAGDRPAAGR